MPKESALQPVFILVSTGLPSFGATRAFALIRTCVPMKLAIGTLCVIGNSEARLFLIGVGKVPTKRNMAVHPIACHGSRNRDIRLSERSATKLATCLRESRNFLDGSREVERA